MAVELLVAVATVGRNSQDRLTCIGVYTLGSSFHSPGFPQVCLELVSATAANFQLPIDLCISIALQNRGYYSSARATIGPHVI